MRSTAEKFISLGVPGGRGVLYIRKLLLDVLIYRQAWGWSFISLGLGVAQLEHMQEEQAAWAARRADLAERASDQLQELQHNQRGASASGAQAPLAAEAERGTGAGVPRDPGDAAGPPGKPASGGFYTPPEWGLVPKANGALPQPRAGIRFMIFPTQHRSILG